MLKFKSVSSSSVVLGSRIKTSIDFGLVSLDISSLRASDAGIYTCKAVNMNGEATSTTSIKVQGKYLSHMSYYKCCQPRMPQMTGLDSFHDSFVLTLRE